jgi:hypothetical protein
MARIQHKQHVSLALLKSLLKDGVIIFDHKELSTLKTKTLIEYESYLENIIDLIKVQPIIEAREAVQAIMNERKKSNA